MRKIAIFLIGLSTLLLFLHSITPHTHHKATQSYTHSISEVDNSNDILSWLQFVFHQDLGQEHLEHFQNDSFDHVTLLPDLAFLAFALSFSPIIEEPLEHKKPYIFSIKDSDLLNQSPLRGPPSLV